MHHFPWLRNRTTEHWKAGKARNTKENRRSKEFSTVWRPPVVLLSSPSADLQLILRDLSPEPTGSGDFLRFEWQKRVCFRFVYLPQFDLRSPSLTSKTLEFEVEFYSRRSCDGYSYTPSSVNTYQTEYGDILWQDLRSQNMWKNWIFFCKWVGEIHSKYVQSAAEPLMSWRKSFSIQ